MLEEKAYARDLAEMRAKLGLDRPLHVQYVEWLGRVRAGGPGRVPLDQAPRRRGAGPAAAGDARAVAPGHRVRRPHRASRSGVVSATRQDTLRDYAARSTAVLGLSVPSFWLATLVIVLPAIWWGWRPVTRLRRVLAGAPRQPRVRCSCPALILGLASAAALMRLIRGMLLEVLRQDYVRTAWAKGLREGVIVLKHSLRNAVIPVVTVLGIQIAQVLGGTVIIETIFGLPGMSRFLFDAINQRDYPVIQGINLVVVSLIVLINLTVDAALCPPRPPHPLLGSGGDSTPGRPPSGEPAERRPCVASVDPTVAAAGRPALAWPGWSRARKPLGSAGGL